jgi:glycine/D-amino acid oxidase-like deaminating enzyme
LIIESEEIPTGHIFKKNYLLAPLLAANHFWLGSNYHWEFPDAEPTKAFRESAEKVLADWLKVPYRIVDHKASIRPATIERRPFVGLHPANERIGMLNGMGTKGASLAPYFANQLVQHLVNEKPIHSEADILRFKNVLQRDILH